MKTLIEEIGKILDEMFDKRLGWAAILGFCAVVLLGTAILYSVIFNEYYVENYGMIEVPAGAIVQLASVLIGYRYARQNKLDHAIYVWALVITGLMFPVIMSLIFAKLEYGSSMAPSQVLPIAAMTMYMALGLGAVPVLLTPILKPLVVRVHEPA